jgi:transcriptional regulator with XRE-family HTH domain
MDSENRNTIIGKRLTKIRESLGLNQKVMAAELGIQPPSLSALENGKNGISLDTIYKMEQEFRVNVDFLLFGKGPMFYTKNTDLSMILEKLLEYGKPTRDLLITISKSRLAFFNIMAAFDSCYIKNKAEIDKQIEEYDKKHTEPKNKQE